MTHVRLLHKSPRNKLDTHNLSFGRALKCVEKDRGLRVARRDDEGTWEPEWISEYREHMVAL